MTKSNKNDDISLNNSYNEPVIKKEGVNPFNHPAVKKWHEQLLTTWYSDAPVALLLPCTAKKPYGQSPTHKIAYAIANRGHVQVYSVSEPMLLVPREFETQYPFNNYDYPPKLMTKEEREEFIYLLSEAIKKVAEMHKVIIAVLPSHHRSIFQDASKAAHIKLSMFSKEPANEADPALDETIKILLLPYGRLAFRSVKSAAVLAVRLANQLEGTSLEDHTGSARRKGPGMGTTSSPNDKFFKLEEEKLVQRDVGR